MDAGTAVAVDVAGPLRGQVERVVEGSLGWQVVAADDPVLPPRCVLADVGRAAAHVGGPAPVVLLVGRDDDPVRVARAARRAVEVVEGVPDAAVLVRVVAAVGEVTPGRGPWCTVVAAAGGVGATTVATALAALRAWEHGPTLVAVSGPTHQEGAPVLAPSDLAGPAVWAAAAPVVAVAGCRVVGLRSSGVPPDAGPVPLVHEAGVVDGPADVLVARPDRAGLAAAGGPAGTVVLVGRGPVQPGRFRAVAGAVVEVPWSARVAAAAADGRLPADVPGSWLRPLVPVVTTLAGREVAV